MKTAWKSTLGTLVPLRHWNKAIMMLLTLFSFDRSLFCSAWGLSTPTQKVHSLTDKWIYIPTNLGYETVGQCNKTLSFHWADLSQHPQAKSELFVVFKWLFLWLINAYVDYITFALTFKLLVCLPDINVNVSALFMLAEIRDYYFFLYFLLSLDPFSPNPLVWLGITLCTQLPKPAKNISRWNVGKWKWPE